MNSGNCFEIELNSNDLIEKLKKVYSYFSDEQSRRVFLHRFNYLISGNINWMLDIAKQYNKEMFDAWDDFDIRDRINELGKEREIILYGAGLEGKNFLKWNDSAWHGWNLKIKCFCDQDINKQEHGWEGYPVISPEMLIRNHKNAIVIITSTKYEKEILGRLIVGGLLKTKFFTE